MSAHGFKSLFMVASVAGAALGCYLVSLNVASERAKLESVEGQIVSTQHDIRLLQTEIGTRGRLAQLERWNVGFIRLSAPTADQFLEGGFQLATMVKPVPKSVIGAPVVLASAPVEQSVSRPAATTDGDESGIPQAPRARAATQRPAPSAGDMMHVASYERPIVETRAAATTLVPPKSAATNRLKTASADALAPLPKPKAAAKATPPSAALASGSAPRKSKESGTPQ